VRTAALAILALGGAALAPAAIEPIAIPAFSSAPPGARLPAGWRPVTIPNRRAAELSLVRDEDRTVLRVRSEGAFGSAAHDLSVDPARASLLSWRWKIDRVVDKAQLEKKDGEDFAARVYVSFDYPVDQLPFATRTKLRIARAFFGEVPAAAICYVWDNRHAPGTAVWSPYYDYVRVVVLRSGNARAGQWVEEQRDIAADFRAAFGARWKKPVPPIAAITVGNDTDQTGETATAWFGDFRLEPRP
jgi:hypothetical protein